MPDYFIQMDCKSEPFAADTPQDARDTMINLAFERQLALIKQFDGKKRVRTANFRRAKTTVFFFVDGVVKERWTLKAVRPWWRRLLGL